MILLDENNDRKKQQRTVWEWLDIKTNRPLIMQKYLGINIKLIYKTVIQSYRALQSDQKKLKVIYIKNKINTSTR